MILLIIRMKVLSEKRMELSQTIASLIGSIRTEKGCKRCDFCQDMEDENELCLLGEWDTQENLKSHLKSERFKVLRGAMNLLKEPYKMVFHTVFRPKGMVETYFNGQMTSHFTVPINSRGGSSEQGGHQGRPIGKKGGREE
jgi:quinol monooxygenase YgiN